MGLLDTNCVSVSQQALLASADLFIDSNAADKRWKPVWVDFESDSDAVLEGIGDFVSKGCILMIDYLVSGDISSFAQYFSEDYAENKILRGWVSQPMDTTLFSGNLTSSNPWINSSKYHFIYEPYGGHHFIRHLYNWGDNSFERVDETLANISESLTRYLRALPAEDRRFPSYSRFAEGQTLNTATCLDVHWSWIAYPAIVTALSLVFLATVATLSINRHVPVWKESPLVWLFRGPSMQPQHDQQEQQPTEVKRVTPGPALSNMESVSKHMRVRLVGAGDNAAATNNDPYLVVYGEAE